MPLFKELEGDVAIVARGGIYKQVPIFARNGYLFAAWSGGYVRLKSDGSTSKDKLRLVHLETEAQLCKDTLGRLGTTEMSDAKPLLPDDAEKLMLVA